MGNNLTDIIVRNNNNNRHRENTSFRHTVIINTTPTKISFLPYFPPVNGLKQMFPNILNTRDRTFNHKLKSFL